ncbi:MAG: hypothetical protein IJK02_08300 [Clostridia bacterium]|nr:hypothetical protein [Clostridia bacterium]
MFHFIHTYAPGVTGALAKSGLWRDGDGLKLMHKPGFTPPDDYNSALAPGAPLSGLLEELKCPFYIDRLQGGIGFTHNYPYAPAVTARLKRELGDRFWGFQMHEWASNLKSDMDRILALFQAQGADPADPGTWRAVLRKVAAGELQVFLETHTAADWAEKAPFFGLSDFLPAAYRLYRRRTKETGGYLLPADSYFMAPRTEIANGAKRLLPEIGWQIPNLRVQLAFTRGMAEAAGIPWGVYYECWQNTGDAGLTIPFALRTGQDEWLEDLLHRGAGSDLPPEKREHGGSSLSLAARAWRFAYFSGAACIGEEYGVCNTFRDPGTGELGPYGEMKREFLRFTEAFPDIGTPFVPIAAVLPKEMPMLDVTLGERYLGYPTADPACPLSPDAVRRLQETAAAVFGTQGRYGNMGHVLKTGGLPAVCDIVYDDMPGALSRYGYLIDLTGSGRLKKRYPNTVTVEEADRLLDTLLPCRFGGGLTAAYNRLQDGWYILVMNNDGVFHDNFAPDIKLPEAAVRAEVKLLDPRCRLIRAAGDGVLHDCGGDYAVSLQAGEWMLLRINNNM